MPGLRRDPRLRALSDEHHQALVLARRALISADRDGPSAHQEVWTELVRRFWLELMPHFTIEEQLILPALEAVGELELGKRIRVEHAELRRLVHDTPAALEARLSEFGVALRDHVRFEERVLFSAVQEKVGDEVLEAVAAACRRMSTVDAGSCRPGESRS